MEGSGIIYNKEIRELGISCFEYFNKAIKELSNQDKIYVGLSGGRSFVEFYKLLSEKSSEVNFSKIIFCFVDERIVPLNSEESNYKLVKELLFDSLLSKGLILENQIKSINFYSPEIEVEYSKEVPRIDIGFFGSGEDAHIASLFPQSNQLNSIENNYIFISDSPKLPSKRITITPKMILGSSYSIIFFVGEGKREAYDKFRDNSINYNNCPAKLIMSSKNWQVFTNLN